MTAVLFLTGAYLLGAVPSGLLVVRLLTGTDIRRYGSGNIGATNARRAAGNLGGLMTLAGDVAKGAVPAALALSHAGLSGSMGGALPAAAVLAAFLGHLYPVYLRFRGGKGVATAGGGLAVLAPASVLAALVVFLAVVAVDRRVSLGSMAAAATLPLSAVIAGAPGATVVLATVIALLILLRHRDNMRRLRNGTEPRIGKG